MYEYEYEYVVHVMVVLNVKFVPCCVCLGAVFRHTPLALLCVRACRPIRARSSPPRCSTAAKCHRTRRRRHRTSACLSVRSGARRPPPASVRRALGALMIRTHTTFEKKRNCTCLLVQLPVSRPKPISEYPEYPLSILRVRCRVGLQCAINTMGLFCVTDRGRRVVPPAVHE